jgi:hypothetical protein
MEKSPKQNFEKEKNALTAEKADKLLKKTGETKEAEEKKELTAEEVDMLLRDEAEDQKQNAWDKELFGQKEEIQKETSPPESEKEKWEMPEEAEGVPLPSTEAERKIAEEIERMPEEKKKSFARGIANLGYISKEYKAKFFKKTLDKSAKISKEKSALHRFLTSYGEIYAKEAEDAEKKRKQAEMGKMQKASAVSMLAGNAIRIGRILYDVNYANPFRHVMAASMFIGKSSEAAKEARLKNEKVIEKTRIDDEKEAYEEAWKLHEAARKEIGKNKPSMEALENAYKKFVAKEDLENRLAKNSDGIAKSVIQKIISKDIEMTTKKISWKMEKIEKNKKLSDEEINRRQNKIIKKYEKFLKDMDRIVTQAGTVDLVSYGAKRTEQFAKAVSFAMIFQTIGLMAAKAAESFSETDKITDLIEKSGEAPSHHAEKSKSLIEWLTGRKPEGETLEKMPVKPSEPQELPQKEPEITEIAEKSATLSPATDKKITIGPLEEQAARKIKAPIEPLETQPEKIVYNFKTKHSLLEKTGADIEFADGKIKVSYEIGKGKDFNYLDQALRRVVMDNVKIKGTKFKAIDAAKVENALANLRELTLGHNVAGFKAENFKDIIDFNEKSGQLEIKDYAKFEDRIKGLLKHSEIAIDEKSDALAYVNDTPHKNWQEMLEQKIGPEKMAIEIEDFNKSELVKQAEEKLFEKAENLYNEFAEKLKANPRASFENQVAFNNFIEKDMGFSKKEYGIFQTEKIKEFLRMDESEINEERPELAEIPTKKLMKLKKFILKENPSRIEKELTIDKFLKMKISSKLENINKTF